jgi:tetratricopeptide (TPR) repeat protein
MRAISAALLLSVIFAAHVGAQRIPDVALLFAQYDDGRFDEAVQSVSSFLDLRTFRERLDTAAPGWIRAAADAPGRERRRLVAASLALETAYANRDRWSDARHLVEWGCALQRAAFGDNRVESPARPSHGYRVWQLTSVALIESAFDHIFLMGVPPIFVRDPDTGRGRTRNHLSHAIAHLADEPRIFLSFAVAVEYASWGSDSPMPVWIDRDRLEDSEPLSPDSRTDASTARALLRRPPNRRYLAAAKSDTLWELADVFRGLKPVPVEYARLANAPSIRAEIHVRLANTYLRLARPDLALPLLEQSLGETGEPFLIYLAHYFRGRVLEMLERNADAEEAYRQALAAMPGAQSASMSLAALRFAAGRRDAALDAIGDSLRRAAPDPWRLYQAGSARYLPSLVEQLRKELR